MKRTIIFTALALLINAGVTAQSANQARTETRNEAQNRVQTQEQAQTHAQIGEQVRVQNQANVQEQPRYAKRVLRQERKQLNMNNEAAEHGQAVRERARTTESGPGKGEAVSQQARIKGETQKVRIREENRALNGAAPRNQGVSASQMKRSNMNMSKGAGSGRR